MPTALLRTVIPFIILFTFAAAASAQPAPAPGFKVTQWAAEPLLASPVAISFDPHGRAYIAQTTRRRTSDYDIRSHTDWMIEDLSLRSIEEFRAFLRKKLDPSLSATNLWQADLNADGLHDWRDLTVESERVLRLEDSDGDGVADKSILFAEGFNTEVTGVAAGVLFHEGDVYVTVAPDLWKLRDTNDDAKADERQSLAHGFAHHIGYGGHDLASLMVGPDGKIYWAMGDLGVNATGLDGTRQVYPHQGAIMRCNPDGSEFEVFAHGLRNPHEFAFNQFGDIISVDNDSDRAGDAERIVHIAEGSDSGWRQFWQYFDAGTRPWLTEGYNKPRFDGQAAFILPPVAWYDDGPCGFRFNPGTALGERWNNHFFITLFKGSPATGKVKAFTLKPSGATYALDQDTTVLEGMLPTGIDFAPDGALYVLDWVNGWVVTDQGRVWRLDVSTEPNPLRRETATLLREGMSNRREAELSELLGHADMRVRMAAQFELAKRSKEGHAALIVAAKSAKNQLARLHAIWGIGQQARRQAKALEPILSLLHDADPEIRAQTAKIIGDAKYTSASSELAKLLSDTEPRVRYFAAIALRKAGDIAAMPAVRAMLKENNDADAYLRHAGAMALSGIGDPRTLSKLAEHPSRAVRLAAVVAMRMRRDAEVAAFLADRDELVVLEAARAIHDDDGLPSAWPALAALIDRSELRNEHLLRRVVNANLRLGAPANAQALAAFAADTSRPTYPRIEALWSLANWDNPPPIDRVEGKYVTFGNRTPAPVLGAAATALNPHLLKLLDDDAAEVKIAAAQAAGALQLQAAADRSAQLALNAAQPPGVRLASLTALGQLKPDQLAATAAAALKDSDEKVRQEAQRLVVAADPTSDTALNVLKTLLKSGSTSDRQAALTTLGTIPTQAASAVLESQLDQLLAGKLKPSLELDLLEAAAASDSPGVRQKLAAFEATRSAADPLSAFREVLQGGDAEAGRAIVFEHIAAQCIRCHKFKGQGGTMGPDLTDVGKRADRRHLVESLVNPNAVIAPGFGMVAVTLKDGRTLSGTLKDEANATLTLLLPDGKTGSVQLSDIATRTPAMSAMPPMNGILTKRQLRDVVEFLANQD